MMYYFHPVNCSKVKSSALISSFTFRHFVCVCCCYKFILLPAHVSFFPSVISVTWSWLWINQCIPGTVTRTNHRTSVTWPPNIQTSSSTCTPALPEDLCKYLTVDTVCMFTISFCTQDQVILSILNLKSVILSLRGRWPCWHSSSGTLWASDLLQGHYKIPVHILFDFCIICSETEGTFFGLVFSHLASH